LSWEDKHRDAEKRNHTFFSAIRGQAHLTIEYKDSGVAVRPLFNPTLDPSGIKTADQMFYEQYLATIGPEVHDIDLFARMSFRPLGVNDNDAPPEEEGDPIPRERFHIDCNGKQALVFCIDLEGLIDAVTLGGITQRRLLHIQVHGPGWNTLCIVNHQRHIPIARRAVENAIPDNVSQIARESGLSLITALDLRLLIQGIVEHKWAADGIRGLLFLPGRQGVVPPAYRKIGNYLRFFDKQSAMSVQVADGETVKVGDTLGVRLAGRYHEERIESLQIDRVSVITAIGPCKAGIGTKLCKRELSVGQAVFIRTP
jgi:hypothetical protein